MKFCAAARPDLVCLINVKSGQTYGGNILSHVILYVKMFPIKFADSNLVKTFTMKKYVLSLAIAVAAFGQALAQVPAGIAPEQMNAVYTGKVYTKQGNKLVPVNVGRRSGDHKDWYQFVPAYEEGTLLGQKLSTFVSFIYPDTTAYTVSNTGVKNKIGFHVIGSTFDPKDSNFQAVGKEVFTKFQPYTMDSVFFQQSYIRFLDSTIVGGNKVAVVDTVFIQYFDITGMDVRSYTFGGTPPTFYYGAPKAANFNASPKNLLNTAALKTDTIFLTKELADSVALNGANTSFFLRGIQIPVGLTSKATATTPITNNLMAFAVTFKPMVKTSLGDTLIAYDGSTWKKKYNFYGLRMAFQQNHDQAITTQYRINNSFITNFEVLYGASLFGTFALKSYIAGTFFGSTFFMPNAFHITTTNLKTEGKANGITNAMVFPNPAASGNSITVSYISREQGAVSATITDMNGRVVRSIPARTAGAGENVFSISTEGMARGMYMLNLNGKAGSTATKFTIQ